jgi:FixJ family two-component response regulator
LGAEVHAFDGIIAAMKYISSKKKIDLIVTDIKLPYSSGIEFIHDLREKQIIIPYIIVSGSMDKTILAKAMKMGCKVFFFKPYDKIRLLETVEKFRREETTENFVA